MTNTTTRTGGRVGAILAAATLIVSILAGSATVASAASSSIVGWVEYRGQGVAGVQVDLFEQGSTGGRGTWLRSTKTGSGGGLWFGVDAGCYVLTFVAPDGTTFTNGSRWFSRWLCVGDGARSQHNNASLSNPPQQGCAPGDFERVFRDDFSGSSLSSEWMVFNSAGHAGNGYRRPSAVEVRDGRLVITAQNVNGSAVSGGIQHLHNQTYGRYRVRVRTDPDPHQVTNGVVLTWPSSNRHPEDGENNIYETYISQPDRNPFFSFVHRPGYGAAHQTEWAHHLDGTQWQTMTMDWYPNGIWIKPDGGQGHWLAEDSANRIPDVNHRLTIQLDAFSWNIPQRVQMEVDWVEVYKRC